MGVRPRSWSYPSLLGRGMISTMPLRRSPTYALIEAAQREGRLSDAEVLATSLLVTRPDDKLLRMKLAGLLESLGKAQEAQRVVADGIGSRRLDAIASSVELMRDELQLVGGRWRFVPRGVSAVCVIQHQLDGCEPLISKVVDRTTRMAMREILFFTKLVGRSGALRSLAPRLVDVRPVNGSRLTMITMEMARGRRPGLGDLEPVMRAWIQLSHGYRELLESGSIAVLKRSRYIDSVRNAAWGFLRGRVLHPETFAWIHTRSSVSNLFANLRRRTRKAARLATTVRELEALWMQAGFFSAIEAANHYTLMHGDFHSSNLTMDDGDGTVTVIDWATLSIGPPAADLARFLTAFTELDFEDVSLRVFPFLDTHPCADMGPQARSLMILSLVARWLTHVPADSLDARFDSTLGPAMQWLRDHRPTNRSGRSSP